jgi:hypothetical protein
MLPEARSKKKQADMVKMLGFMQQGCQGGVLPKETKERRQRNLPFAFF